MTPRIPAYTYVVSEKADCLKNESSTPPARKKSRKRRRKLFKIFAILTAVLLSIAIYFQTNVTRVLVSVSEAAMRAAAVEAINEAVYRTLGENSSYEDLVRVNRDETGAISAITADSLKINKIARDTASLSQKYLRESGKKGVPIPVGALTGIEALSGMGKKITIDILPVCSVVCSFTSDFQSAGINQTKHSVYLNVVADVSIVMASRTDNFTVQTDILAGECVLVGKIPDVYLQNRTLGNDLGL